MSNTEPVKLPMSFWIIAVVALVWNLAGVATYISDVTLSEEALAQLSEEHRGLREATPVWVTGAYAIAVFAGALGAVSLLLRRNWAVPLFGASIIAVLVQMGFMFIAINAAAVLGASAMIMPAVIIAAGAFLFMYAMNAKSKGWLR